MPRSDYDSGRRWVFRRIKLCNLPSDMRYTPCTNPEISAKKTGRKDLHVRYEAKPDLRYASCFEARRNVQPSGTTRQGLDEEAAGCRGSMEKFAFREYL